MPVVEAPMGVIAVLLAVLAVLFGLERTAAGKIFRFVPLLVFCYFVPAVLSNAGFIPLSSPAYSFVKTWLLPASLILLVIAADVPAVLKLGRNAVLLFVLATASIVIGAPIAFLALGWMIPVEALPEAWKGLAALCGSWIGGGANFVAIGESVGTSNATLSMMVVLDVAVANVWTATLFFFAGREQEMDARLGADRTTLDDVRARISAYQAQVARPTTLPDLLAIVAIGIVPVVFVRWVAERWLPDIGDIINDTTWVVAIVTAIGLGLSFTRLRSLDGAGASRVGSVFLYLLVAVIGAGAEFHRVLENVPLLLVASLWMAIHAAVMLIARWWLKAPVFFLAVGSQANVGGAASAPVVAAAFHPALAPVGVLLAILGYVLGTYGGIVVAFMLQRVAAFYGAA